MTKSSGLSSEVLKTDYRISFPLMIGAMVIFISMIPQIANPNVETVLGIMVSMPFAIFAVRSLLSPGDQIGQTIIDIAILGLYALLILAGVLLMWRVNRFKKKERNIKKRKKSSRITSR